MTATLLCREPVAEPSTADARLVVPLRYKVHVASMAEPITMGVPFAKGTLRGWDKIQLEIADDVYEASARMLARWPDDSIQWLLVEALLRDVPPGEGTAELVVSPAADGSEHSTAMVSLLHVQPAADASPAFANIVAPGGQRYALEMRFTDRSQRRPAIHWTHSHSTTAAAVFTGEIVGHRDLRLEAKLTPVAGAGLVRCDITLHNARRAKHPGGLWDLGDAGSLLFGDLSLVIAAPQTFADTRLALDGETHRDRGTLVQHSSGGANWRSENHVDRHGDVPLTQAGYTWSVGGQAQATGDRASPLLICKIDNGHSLSVAMPEFWQQFPKVLEIGDREIRVGLFPAEHAALHELQGGERKRHTVWLAVTAPDSRLSLRESSASLHERPTAPSPFAWVHQPSSIAATPAWHAASGAWPTFSAGDPLPSAQPILAGALRGPHSFAHKREAIDEYGWRNYGDVWGDHEAKFYRGAAPVISHYNNQFDLLYGALAQWASGGDEAWWQFAAPLARHVVDIDIYHTTQDKPAFSGGLFWHTDHYFSAASATHRTYSRSNAASKHYGGGPSSEHNYATGLLHYYYLTGDEAAHDAVIGLADWTMAMDDGRRAPWRWLDDGPTGLASRTYDDSYHGPGRGAANSVQTLLDAWQLTRSRRYLDYAETLIRRCVHPRDDIDARQLQGAERRWSYTMFLVAMDRYLDAKAAANELDEPYAYARESLLAYARWMLVHERPYLERKDELEFVTETWAAQELRKANVLRLAARDADEELASQLLRKADELSDYAWRTLYEFDTWHTTRAVAIVATEALREAQHRRGEHRRPAGPTGVDFGAPQAFEPSLARVKRRLKSPGGIVQLIAVVARRLFGGWASSPSPRWPQVRAAHDEETGWKPIPR